MDWMAYLVRDTDLFKKVDETKEDEPEEPVGHPAMSLKAKRLAALMTEVHSTAAATKRKAFQKISEETSQMYSWMDVKRQKRIRRIYTSSSYRMSWRFS